MGKNKTLEKKVVISLRKSTSPATHKYTLAHVEERSLQCMAAAIHRQTPNISTDENINKNKYACWNYSFYPQPHTANWGNATTQ